MTPRVSFVIPAHNAQKYLNDAVYSCLRQSVKQVEVIVVNDGSTDGTAELLDHIAKEEGRVRPLHLEKNVGRSAARNLGNAEAQAPLIFVLDADDMCTKTRVRDTLAAFELKKADLVYGAFYNISEVGQVIGKIGTAPFNKEIAIRKKVNSICHSTMAYRKEVAMACPYDTGTYSEIGCDDWKFQWEAFLKGFSFVPVKAPLAYYRVCSGTISSTRDPQEVLKLKEEFLATV